MFPNLRLRSLLIPLPILVSALCAMPAHAQSQPSPPPLLGMPTPLGDANPDRDAGAMTAKMLRDRNVMRQKEIVDETNQLLDLAQKLKDAVDKTSKDQLSLDVVRKAEEIEKLAKDVKTKMRDGNS
jgi:hypothetical protein